MRRNLLLAALGAMIPTAAIAREASRRPNFSRDGRFHWLNPGSDPYQGEIEAALGAFARRGVPQEILGEMFLLHTDGRFSRGIIRDGEPFDFMMSGRGVVLQRVVALTRFWPTSTSKEMNVYAAGGRGIQYELCLPKACWNWTFRSYPFGTQPVCIPCIECG